MTSALGALHALGAKLDWDALYPGPAAPVSFPKYAWAHESFWHQTEANKAYLIGNGGNPLLGMRRDEPADSWTNEVNVWMAPYLADHRIQGHVLLPGTAFLEMGMAAARSLGNEGPLTLENIRFHKALFLSGGDNVCLSTSYDSESLTFHVQARERSSAWQLHVSGRVMPGDGVTPETIEPESLAPRFAEALDSEACYRRFLRSGIEYGPSFRGIRRLWTQDGEALAEIEVPESLRADLARYEFHPAVLDACLQALIGGADFPESKSYLPVSIDRLRVFGRPGVSLWSYVREARIRGEVLEASIRVLDGRGQLLAEIEGLRCQGVEDKKLAETGDLDSMFYRFSWTPAEAAEAARPAGAFEGRLDTREVLEELSARAANIDFSAVPPDLDRLAVAHAVNALLDLGWNYSPGDGITGEEMAASLAFCRPAGFPAGKVLGILLRNGVISESDGRFEVLKTLGRADTREIFRRAFAKCPEWQSVTLALDSLGRRLADILAGKVEPASLIPGFLEGGAADALRRDAPPWRAVHLLSQLLVLSLVSRATRAARVRILDLGRGAGGVTPLLLPVLAEFNPDYVVGRASVSELEKSRVRFGGFPFVRFEAVDPAQEIAGPGLKDRSFDIIVSSFYLGGERDFGASLDRLSRLLAPGGRLILAEPKAPGLWFDLLYGLLDTSRSGEDVSWEALLRERGFAGVADVTAHRPDGCAKLVIADVPVLGEVDSVLAAAPGAAAGRSLPAEAGGRWLVLCDNGGTGEALARELTDAGSRAIRVFQGEAFHERNSDDFEVDPESRESVGRLLDALGRDGDQPLRGIIHLAGLDVSPVELDDGDSARRDSEACLGGALVLVQELEARCRDARPRLWLVTRGAQAVDGYGGVASPFAAGIWGFGRVIRNEFPLLNCSLVDLDHRRDHVHDGAPDAALLGAEVLAGGPEDEIAFRDGRRMVRRMVKEDLARVHEPGTEGRRAGEQGYRLEATQPGALAGLGVREGRRRAPGPNEVEIEVRAAGLNFSDVMKALNLYPGLPEGDVPLGIECAGTVSRVGKAVRRLAPGDRVFGLAQPSFASHVTVLRQGVLHLPDGLGFAEAATVPIAFLTAHFGLVRAARLRRGESVLIHSATGGVGLAAIQVARDLGARVYATAGTEERRDLLRRLGVDDVWDSRSLRFSDAVKEATGGRGVDVVLNSLPGEAVSKGLEALAAGGRFVEIGKRDIYGNRRLGLLPFRNNLSFQAVDLDKIIRESPAEAGRIMRLVLAKLRQGVYSPLPFRAVPLALADDAFRSMAQARHVGKLVITVGDHAVPVSSRTLRPEFRADGAYLVTGGFGGFGLRIARWLAEGGAGSIALMGRGGPGSEEARQTLAALEAGGCARRDHPWRCLPRR